MGGKCSLLCVVVLFFSCATAQEETVSCYGSGSVALSVILTFLLTLLIVALGFVWWKKLRAKKSNHLILETDPEKGKGEYAFDNPGFKDTTILPITKTLDHKSESSKSKWNHWSPLSALTIKSEKKKTVDDTAIQENEAKIIALRSHDFTGLGFNICGNMKEGIYIKDVLHRGPAFESGKLVPGDRINSLTINFEHMVYEDALTILSYASPYDVIIEASSSGKFYQSNSPGQGGQPSHPVYRSSSFADLYRVAKSSKKTLFGEDNTGSLSSNYSSLQKSRSNMTTLERKESKSPTSKLAMKQAKHPVQEQLKSDLEQAQTQKQHDSKHPKFGIRVLPHETQQTSPKSKEQNENNWNIERHLVMGIDEVDETTMAAPPVKKREKKAPARTDAIERNSSLTGSGIRRDKDGIPLELPAQMLNAATAAINNRKCSREEEETSTVSAERVEEKTLTVQGGQVETSTVKAVHGEEDEAKAVNTVLEAAKRKGKAPPPPEDAKHSTNFDEIQSLEDEEVPEAVPDSQWEYVDEKIDRSLPNHRPKDYNSDSDVETDNQSSVNTIELNATDITIHQTTEEEERRNRKTLSTGDLSKISKSKSSNGTLERAQSLDISDAKHKTSSSSIRSDDEDIFRNRLVHREPRLSLILDGLNTFQRNRLKKSTEWGNLEDAIMKLEQEDSVASKDSLHARDGASFSEDAPEFDALVNKIIEIKRESESGDSVDDEPSRPKAVLNQIWPVFDQQAPTDEANSLPQVQTDSSARQIDNEVENEAILDNTVNQSPPVVSRVINNKIYEPWEGKQAEEEPESTAPLALQKPNAFLESVALRETNKPVTSPQVPDRASSRQRVPENIPIPPPASEKESQDDWTEPDTSNAAQSSPSPVLSKIPLLNSMVKKEAMKKSTILTTNNTDETKTAVVSLNIPTLPADLLDITENFLYTEQINCNQDDYTVKTYHDTNIPDDIKVSRHHSYNSLEKETIVKSDDAKSKDLTHVSNVNVNTNGDSELHSLELTINEPTELYTTALDGSSIKNLTLTEVVSALKDDSESKDQAEQVHTSTKMFPYKDTADNSVESSSFTYITEIQVTPNPSTETNVPEARNLDTAFENYVKSFESKRDTFESNIQEFDKNLEEFINDEPPAAAAGVSEQVVEKELHKIHEIAEQQLKKLPEMKFTTSSYEQSKTPEKRQSQIELLRSNFEKSPPKSGKPDSGTKSRIPIATTAKTPPTSPERRNSHNLDTEHDRAILELMSSSVTSTPYRYQSKPSNKNVTVTSIRSSSKIPSGLPTLGGGRSSLVPRKIDVSEGNAVQVSSNGNLESSFKQWVFSPSNVTNVVVTDNKQEK